MSIRLCRWYGGKARMAHKILACVPPNITDWYEACCGSAVVTLNAPRHNIDQISDLDKDLIHLLRTLADRREGAKLLDFLLSIDYEENFFNKAKEAKTEGYRSVDDLTRAVMEFALITMSFNATRKSFSRKGTTPRDYRALNAYHLPLVYERLAGVEVKVMDCIDVVNNVRDNPNAFVFLDVPYRWELRAVGARNIYGHEMDDSQHRALLEVCKNAECCILLCGYHQTGGHDLYDQMLDVGQESSPWRRYTLGEYSKTCQTKSEKDKAEETIWVNYPLPPFAEYYIDTQNPATSLWTPERKCGIITATPEGGVAV